MQTKAWTLQLLKFGETPVAKILDSLIDNKGHAYSKAEIVENADVELMTLNGLWSLLEDWEFVKVSRGNETRYQLNEKNMLVWKLLEFDREAAVYLSERIVEKETAIGKVHRTEVEAIKIHAK